MATVVFIQDILFEHQGVQALSSYIKSRGHTSEVLILYEDGRENILSKLRKISPDIVAFSVISTNYDWATQINREIKGLINTVSIFGGPHPTYFPQFIETDGIDVICRGDGEEALCDLCDHIDKNTDFSNIKNLWVKKNDKIIKNNIRALHDLDDLPFSDREMYYSKYKLLRTMSNKRFLVQRGCSYACSYCSNHSLKSLYDGLGKFVRFRSADSLISEIRQVRSRYPLKTVSFNADSFTLNPELDLFLAKYKREINLPFFCNVRFNELSEDKIIALKNAGCRHIAVGIESGSDRIRNGLLRRNMPHGSIVKNAALLKKHGLKFTSYIMFGLPSETIEDAFETIKLCAAIKSDKIMPTIYQPLIGTYLWDYMKSNALLEDKVSNTSAYSNESSVKLSNKREILNLHKLSFLSVAYPSLIPIIKLLIKMPFNPVFQLVFNYGIFQTVRDSRDMKYIEMLQLASKLRKNV